MIPRVAIEPLTEPYCVTSETGEITPAVEVAENAGDVMNIEASVKMTAKMPIRCRFIYVLRVIRVNAFRKCTKDPAHPDLPNSVGE
jgi:hypothetical protein